MAGFQCRSCGEYHEEIPLAFGPDAPHAWYATPAEERTANSQLAGEQCILNDEFYFVRGCLDLPILGSHEVFRWLVWVSVSEDSFWRMSELWEDPARESEPPYFGWLNTALPEYPDTLDLNVAVHSRPVGERPFVEVGPTEHPLALEQRNGLSWEQVHARVELLLHGPASPGPPQ
jgi:hypothetical protein